jgi:hypothetical protein
MNRAIVAAFDTFEDAERAYLALVAEGVPAGAVSLVGARADQQVLAPGGLPPDAPAPLHDTGAGAARGATIGAAGGLIAGLIALALPGVGPVLAIGPIVGALGGATAGLITGGLIGGLTSLGVSDDEAQGYVELVRGGGTLVVVRTGSDLGPEIGAIMRRHNAREIAAAG